MNALRDDNFWTWVAGRTGAVGGNGAWPCASRTSWDQAGIGDKDRAGYGPSAPTALNSGAAVASEVPKPIVAATPATRSSTSDPSGTPCPPSGLKETVAAADVPGVTKHCQLLWSYPEECRKRGEQRAR